MKVTALAAHTPEAVRAALAARGWEGQPAWFAATGIQPLVVLIEEITEDEREARGRSCISQHILDMLEDWRTLDVSVGNAGHAAPGHRDAESLRRQ